MTVEKLDPGWRIVLIGDDAWELQYQNPATLTWQHVATRDSVDGAKRVYDRLADGWSMAEIDLVEAMG